ncbi:MAG TPA: hypothetical protein VF188_02875 [Longimicrobiales bacterium]
MSGAAAAWQALGEEILAGFCHEMNGRLTTLRGTLELACMDGQVEAGVGDELAAELERLERTVRLVRHLGAERDTEPEPIRPIELLPLAVTLLRHHRELGGIEVEVAEVGDTPAVLAPWSRLLRLLTLLLAGAAEAAQRDGRGGVRVEVRGDGDDVVVEAGRGARPTAGSGAETPAEARAGDAVAVGGAEAGRGAGLDGPVGDGAGHARTPPGDPARGPLVLADALRAGAAALGGTLVGASGAEDRLAVRLPAWRDAEP